MVVFCRHRSLSEVSRAVALVIWRCSSKAEMTFRINVASSLAGGMVADISALLCEQEFCFFCRRHSLT